MSEIIKKSDLPEIKNEKHLLFISYYVKLGNATRAAIKAGYSMSNARHYGCDLKKNPNISQHIKYHLQKIHNKLGVEAEDIVRELKGVGFSRMTDFLEPPSEEELEAVDPEDYEDEKEYEEAMRFKSAQMNIKPISRMGDSIAALEEFSINPKTGHIQDIKTKGKLKALELLGKHIGMWDYEPESSERDRESNLERIRAAIQLNFGHRRAREEREESEADSGQS